MYFCIITTLIISGLIRPAFSTNQAPVFITPTSPINVAENERGQVLLYTLTVSDADNDVFTCSIHSTDPNTFDFGVWLNSSDYGLYVLSGSTLAYSVVPVYTLTLACFDDVDTAYMNVTVNVIPNSPPTFTNLPATMSSQNAKNTDLGDVVFTVTASDTDSNSLTFSMTSTPASPALFAIDVVSGKVTATKDLIYALDNAYDLSITVSDSIDNTTSNLIIPLHNVNSAPIIGNLPSTINVQEDEGGNTVIFTLSITEPDGGDSTTITYFVSPSVYTAKINLNGNDVRITNNNRFDYELVTFLTVTFTVSDGKASNGGYVLTINIVDVNERCDFHYSSYFVTMMEANVGGSVVDPRFNATDEDAGSSFTYSLQNTANATYFSIDPNTGLISFAVDYDIDATYPKDVNFRVYCTDNYGSSDFANLYIAVEDVNDNAPAFSSTSYILYFDQNMAIPSNITTLIASDPDSGVNAVLSYSWTTTGSGGQYFTLCPNGQILLTKDPQSTSIDYGDSFRFVVTVADGGSTPLSGTTIIDLIYQEVNATTPVTTTSITVLPSTSNDGSFFDTPGNVVVLVLGVVLLTVVSGIATHFVKKYFDRRRVTTPEIQKESEETTKKTTSFDFWRADEFNSLSTTVTNSVGPADTLQYSRHHPPPVV